MTTPSKRLVPLIIFLFLIGCVSPAHAQAAKKCEEAQAVDTPCAGILVPGVQALDALKCLADKLPTCEATILANSKKCALAKAALEATIEIERSRADNLAEIVNTATIPPPDPWWEHPALWVAVGFVVGGAAMYGVFELAHSLDK